MTYHDRDIRYQCQSARRCRFVADLASGESAHLGIAVFLGALSKHLDANHVKVCLALTYCHTNVARYERN